MFYNTPDLLTFDTIVPKSVYNLFHFVRVAYRELPATNSWYTKIRFTRFAVRYNRVRS